MNSLIILLRSRTRFWLSAMGENLELGASFKVLVVEERKENGKFGEDATGLELWMKLAIQFRSL